MQLVLVDHPLLLDLYLLELATLKHLSKSHVCICFWMSLWFEKKLQSMTQWTKNLETAGAPPGTGVIGKACKTGLLLVPSFARKLSWPESLQETELQESRATIVLNLPCEPNVSLPVAPQSSKMSCKSQANDLNWFEHPASLWRTEAALHDKLWDVCWVCKTFQV